MSLSYTHSIRSVAIGIDLSFRVIWLRQSRHYARLLSRHHSPSQHNLPEKRNEEVIVQSAQLRPDAGEKLAEICRAGHKVSKRAATESETKCLRWIRSRWAFDNGIVVKRACAALIRYERHKPALSNDNQRVFDFVYTFKTCKALIWVEQRRRFVLAGLNPTWPKQGEKNEKVVITSIFHVERRQRCNSCLAECRPSWRVLTGSILWSIARSPNFLTPHCFAIVENYAINNFHYQRELIARKFVRLAYPWPRLQSPSAFRSW